MSVSILATAPNLTLGDLNGDGIPESVFSGGCVAYGKGGGHLHCVARGALRSLHRIERREQM